MTKRKIRLADCPRAFLTRAKWLTMVSPFAGSAATAFVPTRRKKNIESTMRGSNQQRAGSLSADRGESRILVFQLLIVPSPMSGFSADASIKGFVSSYTCQSAGHSLT